MKKLWLLGIMICLLLCLCCASFAESTCQHDGETYTRQTEEKEYVSSGDNYYHETITRVKTVTYCSLCDSQLGEAQYGEAQTEEEEHSYVDKDEAVTNQTCALCGHENTCGHDDTEEFTGWAQGTEKTYRDTGSNSEHETTGTLQVFDHCADCGVWLNVRQVENSKQEEGHEYSDEGVCLACDHVNTCHHEYEEYIRRDFGFNDTPTYQAIEGNGQYHSASGIGWAYDHCELCGFNFNLVEDQQITEQMMHEYDTETHTCRVCGYTCTQHDLNQYGYCRNHCGYECPTHEYTDGVCASCGGVCEHEYIYTEDGNWVGDPVYTDTGSNNSHRVTGVRTVKKICSTCNVQVETQEKNVDQNEKHDYNASGICTKCGHENTCAHEKTYYTYSANNWENADRTEITGDDEYHTVTFKGTSEDYCIYCGVTIPLVTDGELSEKEAHSYNENGVCEVCGHPCAHSKGTYTDTDWLDERGYTNRPDDHLHHGIKYLIREAERCNTCGAVIGEPKESEDPWVRWTWHSYYQQEITGNETLVCSVCEHENTCTHRFVSRYSWEQYRLIYRETDSNLTHRAIGKALEYEECELCGVRRNVRVNSLHEEQMKHSYDSEGKCYYCGHTNNCSHEGAENVFYAWYSWYGMDANQFVSLSDTDHTHLMKGTIYTYCSLCGAEYNYQDGYLDEKQEHHRYNAQFICIDCGHACENVLRLPDQVDEVKDEAFAGTKFAAVYVPSSCRVIGPQAFADCDQLVYVYLANPDTQIAEDAFAGCGAVVVDKVPEETAP